MKNGWSLGLVAVVMTGCAGLNCYDSCYKIYGESECNLVTVSNSLNGQDWKMFNDQCRYAQEIIVYSGGRVCY